MGKGPPVQALGLEFGSLTLKEKPSHGGSHNSWGGGCSKGQGQMDSSDHWPSSLAELIKLQIHQDTLYKT